MPFCIVCYEEKASLTKDGKCLECARGNSDYNGFEHKKCLLPTNCSKRKQKDCYEHPDSRCELWKITYGKEKEMAEVINKGERNE